MQERHKNRTRYFHELAKTSEKYFIPYIGRFKSLPKDARILEIGQGDGGNLLPFALMGCKTLGVDIDEGRVADARKFFDSLGAKGDFVASDVFLLKGLEQFDVIICHDVMEHIGEKRRFLKLLPQFLARDGVIFMAFPAWQMPFGGHQQIARSKVISHWPFIHLLPSPLYRMLLKASGETNACVNELLKIKETGLSIERFEQMLKKTGTLLVKDRTLWLVNPHYETKFGLRPRRLPKLLARIPYLRNFFITSCFYVLAKET